ncbi:DL-endopeptidase inhibitor IseA family protein [Brevibacillus ginsengisoli]|uniref:DL-endopeptidase inhibitor IseA family protein n=1 Tax=Brevibacillus ginsengisoli TaxID=363854 RepID=UPI003CF3DAD9
MKRRIVSVTASVVAAGMLLSFTGPAWTWADSGSVGNHTISTQMGDQKSDQQRLAELEYAIQPDSADKAAELFVKSYAIRNGAYLFALLTPEAQKREYQRFAQNNWLLGGSSPWVREYRVVNVKEKDESTVEYTLSIPEYTSTGFMGVENASVVIKKRDYKWLIDSFTPLQFKTNMDLLAPKLNEDTLKGLVAEAQIRFWYIATGGKGSSGKASFQPSGMKTPYRWLSEDIGTKENLSNYLGTIYSKEAVKSYLDDQLARKMLLEVDGQLAQPDGDYGSLLDWSKAKVIKLIQQDKRAKADLQVPVGDQGVETKTVDFVFVDNFGWRLATTPQNIR